MFRHAEGDAKGESQRLISPWDKTHPHKKCALAFDPITAQLAVDGGVSKKDF